MVNRPKNIGTKAETAVVRAARLRGFPNADRLTLTGALDRGDVGLTAGVICEVKGGDAARTASDLKIEHWLDETERECVNANAQVAFLVVQRAGVGLSNAHRWWAWWRLSWLSDIIDGDPMLDDKCGDPPVRMLFGDALRLLVDYGGFGGPAMREVA